MFCQSPSGLRSVVVITYLKNINVGVEYGQGSYLYVCHSINATINN